MADKMLLMNKNTPVMRINIDEGEYDVITPALLPYQLRGKLHSIPSELPKTKYEMTQYLIAAQKNYQSITSYASARVLPITRANAKKIYALFGYSQLQTDEAKARIAYICKAVSLEDNYWFKTEKDPSSWKDVNIRENSLSEIVAQVSLRGSSLSLQGEVHTPELNGQGAYAKAWRREDGDLYLHKVGSNGRELESRIEVMVSKLLDKCNVPHVQYEDSSAYGTYTCRCKCMTTESKSIVNGMDFSSYCNVNGIDFKKRIMEIDAENIYKMWIVDYLISNRDRHDMNWGLYYDADSMDIIGCHPLFDHNNAFDEALMQDKSAKYLFDSSMTMRAAALSAMQHVDFHFTKEITADDFLDISQYHSFMDRANELKVPTIEKKVSELEMMEEKWYRFFSTSKEQRGNKIELNGQMIRIAVFDDIYLAMCQKEQKIPDKKIYDHFWKNCVDYQEYTPQFCTKQIYNRD